MDYVNVKKKSIPSNQSKDVSVGKASKLITTGSGNTYKGSSQITGPKIDKHEVKSGGKKKK